MSRVNRTRISMYLNFQKHIYLWEILYAYVWQRSPLIFLLPLLNVRAANLTASPWAHKGFILYTHIIFK